MKGKEWLNVQNSQENQDVQHDFNVSPETVAGWKQKENLERDRARDQSLKFIKNADDHSNPATKISARWRILPSWRQKLVVAMQENNDSEIWQRVRKPAKFPKDTKGMLFDKMK